jgi:hypothetical protein
MSKELKIEAIREKYKDVWVAIEVTKRNKYHAAQAGRVLFHDIDEEKVLEFGVQYRKQQNPKAEIYFTFTGNPFPEDAAVILNAC